TAHEDADIDLRNLHTRIGARGRLGLAAADTMVKRLRVTPGTATPLAQFHDAEKAITLVVDQQLENASQVNFHPMIHTESIGLTWNDFTTFVTSTGHPPLITSVTG